jgi:hypothetical protein
MTSASHIASSTDSIADPPAKPIANGSHQAVATAGPISVTDWKTAPESPIALRHTARGAFHRPSATARQASSPVTRNAPVSSTARHGTRSRTRQQTG